MGDLGAVLGETWRRFWNGSVLWGSPLLLAFGLILGGLLGGLMLIGIFRGFGVFLFFIGLWAYLAMVLAGLTGAWAKAASVGKAESADFSKGTKLFYWRSVGLAGLAFAVYFVVNFILGIALAASSYGMIAAGGTIASTPSLLWQVLIYLGMAGVILLFGFVPAPMGLENQTFGSAMGKALNFVGRRFGLVVLLLLFGFIIQQLPGMLLGRLALGSYYGQISALSLLNETALRALTGRLFLVMIPVIIYAPICMSFVGFSFVVAYARDTGQLGSGVPAPQEALPFGPAPAAGPPTESPSGPAPSAPGR